MVLVLSNGLFKSGRPERIGKVHSLPPGPFVERSLLDIGVSLIALYNPTRISYQRSRFVSANPDARSGEGKLSFIENIWR